MGERNIKSQNLNGGECGNRIHLFFLLARQATTPCSPIPRMVVRRGVYTARALTVLTLRGLSHYQDYGSWLTACWCQKMVPTHSIRAYEAQCHPNGFGKLLVVAEGFEPTGDVVFETTAYAVLLRDQVVIIR